jgi:hypothetical protein
MALRACSHHACVRVIAGGVVSVGGGLEDELYVRLYTKKGLFDLHDVVVIDVARELKSRVGLLLIGRDCASRGLMDFDRLDTSYSSDVVFGVGAQLQISMENLSELFSECTSGRVQSKDSSRELLRLRVGKIDTNLRGGR